MVCTPVPEARKTNSRILGLHLSTTDFRNRRSLARIRSELGETGNIIEVRHVTGHEEEVKEVQSSRIVLFTGNAFTATLSSFAARERGKSLIGRTEVSLSVITINRRSGEAETTREGRRNETTLGREFRLTIYIVTGVHATSSVSSRDEPIRNLLVEGLCIGITIPVVSPSHAPRSTGSVIEEACIFGLSHRSRSLSRLMRVPVAPVRDKTRRGVLASLQVRSSGRKHVGPRTRSVNRLEEFKVSERTIARVESIVPLVTRLNVATVNIVGANPRDNLLGVGQVGILAPLLGSHHESESSVNVCVSCRTGTATFTDAPVHTTAVTAVGCPNAINLIEHGLVVHVDCNQHTVSDSFGNGRTGSFRCINPTIVGVVPGLFPLLIVGLDHVRIGIINGRAVRMLHVLREGVLTRKGGGCRRESERTNRNFENVLHRKSF